MKTNVKISNKTAQRLIAAFKKHCPGQPVPDFKNGEMFSLSKALNALFVAELVSNPPLLSSKGIPSGPYTYETLITPVKNK